MYRPLDNWRTDWYVKENCMYSPSTFFRVSSILFFNCFSFFICNTIDQNGKMVVPTQQQHYVKWFVVSPNLRNKGDWVLISRQGLGNAAVEVLLREGKITAVPEDLSRFTYSVNSFESLTARTKSIIVMHLINSTIHWSHQFQAIVEFLFWLDFSEQIWHRTSWDIASGDLI